MQGNQEATPSPPTQLRVYFSDYFDVAPAVLRKYGAFDVSLINDLPLFIDPFLLFHSDKPEYKALHEEILKYLKFLRAKSSRESLSKGSLHAWYIFHEIRQTWLGFSTVGNAGSGLGEHFAGSLHENLHTILQDFGREKVAQSSHLEKLCLVKEGVGRDNISDFATNLIKEFLLNYTQSFALEHLHPHQRREVNVPRSRFNYDTEVWQSGRFVLPYIFEDFVILTPRDLLTKDDAWINRKDLIADFDGIIDSVSDEQLRVQLNNYLGKALEQETSDLNKGPTSKERSRAVESTIRQNPQVLDHYIKYKEDRGQEAANASQEKVEETEDIFVRGVRKLVAILAANTEFYQSPRTTLDEARTRVLFLKQVIEDMDGWRFFMGKNGKPIRRESDVQLLFRLTWFATSLDVNREVNNGRGPVDFKVSRGANDSSLIEFKLASNTKLEANLKHQVEVYEKASGTRQSLKVVVYFNESELKRTINILAKLKLEPQKDVILIDARPDNKPSASTVV